MRIRCVSSLILVATLSQAARAENPVSGFVRDYAQAAEQGRTSHLLDIDNDTLLMNRNDGFYTSGIRYGYTHSLHSEAQLSRFGWHLGQELYTASDIKLQPELIGPPDHPYAGWLYAGLFKENYRTDGNASRIGLDIGCIGPCAGGEWTQTNFHRLIGQPLPRGWSKQVRNEFGMVLQGEYTPRRWALGSTVDVAPTLKARFGNIYTDAGASITARVGQLNTLPQQPTLHAFLRAGATAVGYNASLQGGYFSSGDPHTVKPKRVVGELELGMAWLRGAYGARLSIVRRGNEIRDLPDSDGTQNFVRLQFVYTP
jgi:lipid A 3-O-deacylase